jgi:hypothetical protein
VLAIARESIDAEEKRGAVEFRSVVRRHPGGDD